MAKYNVTLTQAVYYNITVEADSQSQAEEMAWEELHAYGTDSFDQNGEEWLEDAYTEEEGD